MAPIFILIFIIFLIVLSIFNFLFLTIKFKKLSAKVRLVLFISFLVIAFYSFHSIKQLIHYNTVKNIDTFYLSKMYEEYYSKYHQFPESYSDLRTATKNLHVLIEKDYFLIEPNISFSVDSTSDNNNIIVNFYEHGFNGKDEKLMKKIESPLNIFGIFVDGDFYITTLKFSKEESKKVK